MKNTIFYKIIFILTILILLSCNLSFALENIINKETNNNEMYTKNDNEISVKYEYNEKTNQVVAKIISKIKLKNTKPSWKLSTDGLTYTKTFSENTTYSTPVEDINGVITNVDIKITQIKVFNINIEYEYNNSKTQVIAKIISNIKLKNTKPSWKLSADGLTYTKTFTENTIYSTPVEDIYGNTLTANIKINGIKQQKATLNIKKIYDGSTNTVSAQIISDVPLKNTKPSWKLSADGLTYTKTFAQNTVYSTPVEDIYGNIINVKIEIVEIRSAKVTMDYIYDEKTNSVTAKIISDIKLKNTKPSWKLSSDSLTYTKVFAENTTYSTPVEDIYGNVINVTIKIENIDITPPEITVEYIYNDDDTVTVYMKSNEKLSNTKPSWKLSQNQLVYEKTFTIDQNYITPVADLHGVETNVKIEFKNRKFTYKQDDNSTIKVRYLYIGRTKAIVDIISSVKIADTKPSWKLSADGYKYTKTFYDNNIYTTPIQDINGVTKNVNVIVNLFDNYLTGIDVSAHQGKINWAEVKNSGIDFAIIRCGYGQDIPSQDDTFFARNIAECERLGIPYGIYLYSYALTENDAYSEADHVLRLIKGHNPTFGIWIDIEDADGYKTRYGMPSNETLTNIASIFCDKIMQNGYKAGIYASCSWFSNQLSSPKLDNYNKWIAQWNSCCTYNKKYVMWQYTSKGKVNGILTDVDTDIYYK